ncbi:MAG: hypothetical protein ASARMPRED_005941 [Alectoria sarmentosa]|nr:MAG: hypothetical protein ASARMPRED_005941 [Alectoria sarmentosa]
MEQTRSIQPEDIEFTRLLDIEANDQRRKRIEEMTQQFESDMQPDDIPYTVFADHLTDSMTFVQGLRNAGFEIHEHVVPSHGPETVMVTFASGAHAKRAMLALHLRHFKGMGERMCLMKASSQMPETNDRDPYAPVPTDHTVIRAMAEAFYRKAMGHQRPDRAAAKLAKDAKKAKHRQEMEAARLAKEARMARMAAAQARKAVNIKHAREMKLAADLKRAENRKVEEAERANKNDKVVKKVEEMEEAREARVAAEQAWKAANIKYDQEMKLAKDLRRAENRKNAEDAKLKREAKKMIQWDKFAPDEKSEDESDGFEEMEDIESMAGHEPQWDTFTSEEELETLSAELESMKQQRRHMEDLKTAMLL